MFQNGVVCCSIPPGARYFCYDIVHPGLVAWEVRNGVWADEGAEGWSQGGG